MKTTKLAALLLAGPLLTHAQIQPDNANNTM